MSNVRVTARIPYPDDSGGTVDAGSSRHVEPDRARQLVALRWVHPLSDAVAARLATEPTPPADDSASSTPSPAARVAAQTDDV